jgi:hypothetical protein
MKEKYLILMIACFSFLSCQSRRFGDGVAEVNKSSAASELTLPLKIESFSLAAYEEELNDKLAKDLLNARNILEKKAKTTDETCNIQFEKPEKDLLSPKFILDRDFHPSNFAFALAFGAYDTSWNPNDMKVQLNNWGFENVRFLYENVWGLHAFVAWNKTFAVVHYRGTYNLGGAALDGMFKDMRPDEMKDQEDSAFNGTVHFGFWRAFMALREQMRNAVDEATSANPQLPIVVSGHSLGGATALLASLDIVHRQKNFVSLYTTAQPRVGSEEFAKSVEKKLGKSYFRLRLKGDVVAQVPPTKGGIQSFSNAWSFLSKVAKAIPPFLLQRETYRHAGRVFEFQNPDPYFIQDLRSDTSQDIAFWDERGKKFTLDGFVYHPPLFYLCHFAAIYHEKVKDWKPEATL